MCLQRIGRQLVQCYKYGTEMYGISYVYYRPGAELDLFARFKTLIRSLVLLLTVHDRVLHLFF